MSTTANSENTPKKQRVFFSIIIPMYNRAFTIRRCLDSILSQEFEDYEVIVVDDGSEDDSIAIVESYLLNTHVKLIRNKENRGVCATRGLGVAHAGGKWLMFIDSDDTFHPKSFQDIYNEISSVPEEVSEVRFCYYCEAIGKNTPIPMMPEGIIDFPVYLKWFDKILNPEIYANSDLLYCQRREIYDNNIISWPTDRQYETLYHLRLASKIKMIMSRIVVGTMHNDAPNRATNNNYVSLSQKESNIIRDNANMRAEILQEYREELSQFCPNAYERLYSNAGQLYMWCGERAKGCYYLLKYLQMRPFSITGWGMLLLGLIGPNVSIWARDRFGKKIRSIGRRIGVE